MLWRHRPSRISGVVREKEYICEMGDGVQGGVFFGLGKAERRRDTVWRIVKKIGWARRKARYR